MMLYKMMIVLALMTPAGPETQVHQYNEIYQSEEACEEAAQTIGPETVRVMNRVMAESDLSAFGVRIHCVPIEGEMRS